MFLYASARNLKPLDCGDKMIKSPAFLTEISLKHMIQSLMTFQGSHRQYTYPYCSNVKLTSNSPSTTEKTCSTTGHNRENSYSNIISVDGEERKKKREKP